MSMVRKGRNLGSKERKQTISGLVEELESTFNFAALGLNSENIAKYVSQFPDKSPLELVYKNGDNLEFSGTIREDLSSLIGFKITYQDDDGEKISVILFKIITKDDFEPNETITIGKLREFAKKHGNGKIINEAIARAIWQHAESFYAMQFMLGKRGVEFPGIFAICSSEEYESDSSTWIDWSWVSDEWNYTKREKTRITFDIPIWCHLEIR